MVGVDFVQILHALDAGGEEARVAQLREHRRARRVQPDIAGEFHDLHHRRGLRALRSGERHCTQRVPAGRPEGGGTTDGWAAAEHRIEIERRRPDLVLMDLRMPGVTGSDCVEQIRARPRAE